MKKERLLTLIPGIALLLGFFLPWITFFGMSMSGLTLVQANFKGDNMLGGIIMCLLPLSGIGLIAYSLIPTENRMLRLISNILVAGILVYVVVSIVVESEGKMQLGQLFKVMAIGFYFTLAGVLLSIVDLIRSFTSKPKSEQTLEN